MNAHQLLKSDMICWIAIRDVICNDMAMVELEVRRSNLQLPNSDMICRIAIRNVICDESAMVEVARSNV